MGAGKLREEQENLQARNVQAGSRTCVRAARLSWLTLIVTSFVLAAAAIAPAGAGAAPPLLWQSQVGQTTPGARGIAADPVSGHVFVSDQAGTRIVELDVWGQLVKTWGWDVIASGPNDTVSGQFEICVPAEGDVCKAGIEGMGGAGQFNSAAGIAIDSAGNVYAAETGAPRRVQKFSPDGQFLLSFGGGVNQGGGTPANPGNICTAAHIANGDTCGAGKEGTGPSEFSGFFGAVKTVIAITPDDKVYVGDKDRIQRFNTAGEYQGQVNKVGEQVQQVAVDGAGFLYVSYEKAANVAKPNIRKLDPATGAEVCKFEAKAPRAIAVAPNGDVYAFDQETAEILRFNPECSGSSSPEEPPPLTPPVERFADDFAVISNGLATSSACGIDGVDVYHSNASPSFVRAYGPLPDPDICPPPQVPPAIVSQYAASVGTVSAVVEAQINPRFFEDTRYYVEYGTVDCAVGPCQRVLFPGATLTSEVTSSPLTASANLTGLEPDTTYHFRFVAESSGGGPVFGPDTTFLTYRPPASEPCPNEERRGSAAAGLPDCRAYEMVSPVDKNGGDIDAYFYEGFNASREFEGLDQSTPEGAKLAYTAATAFADPAGSPGVSEYIATRTEGGWTSESIDPPMRGGIANNPFAHDSQFKAFSEDLSSGWLKSESGLPLSAPGPVAGFQNLYRRDGASGEFTWLESSGPEPEPGVIPGLFLFPELQGFSADEGCAVFRVNDALTPEAPQGVTLPNTTLTILQLYLWCEGEGVRLVSVLPDGSPYEGDSTAGTEYYLGGAATNARGRTNTVENALSEDGSRVYWTTSSEAAPKLFLRVNADQPFSEFTEGSGDLSLLASGEGTISPGSATVTGLVTKAGAFAVGESISGGATKGGGAENVTIPAGATITAIGGSTLTLSAPAIGNAALKVTNLRSGSKQVTNLTTSAGTFSAGQPISGTGIPDGTKVTAVGASSLTLSAGVTIGIAANPAVGVALTASNDCTGPEAPCTVQVSPEAVDPKKPNEARFWTANPDGSRAIFSVTGGENAGNLYEYEYDAAKVEGKSTPIAGQTLGVAGASEDASRVYFASREVCSAAPNSEGALAQAGKANLYLYEEGESCAAGELAFVGTLAEEDVGGSLASVPRNHIARATPDGGHLVFVSAARLSDYDNTDVVSGKADREVYLYEAGGELRCASCNPSGARPAGADLGGGTLGTAAWIPGYQHELYGRRPLAEDGSRLFFNSVDALALRDVNGAQDVYQWEAPGTGTCSIASPTYSAQNGGCVDLISSGESPRDSEFVEASATGEDVFIRTESSFVPQDPGSVDIYDARVGGGFPAPLEPVACEGDACSTPPPPLYQTPASAGFQGPGDASPGKKPRCRKGKVRRKGRCVAKRKRHGGKAGTKRRSGR
jgi:hypothetical protein